MLSLLILSIDTQLYIRLVACMLYSGFLIPKTFPGKVPCGEALL